MVAYDKRGSNDRLCDDKGDTCAIIHETLEMNLKHVYMMRTTHFHKDCPLKQTKTPLFKTSVNSHAWRLHLLYKGKSVNDSWDPRKGAWNH